VGLKREWDKRTKKKTKLPGGDLEETGGQIIMLRTIINQKSTSVQTNSKISQV